MQEFMATSERRAELYWWFSTLFAAELSDEQIAEYDTYDVRSFLKSLSTQDPMREAVAELFADSMPNDEFHLVEFNSSPRLLCDLTKDTKEVRRALDTVKAQGWTALFDGIMLATKKMRAATNSRRALVILSDGGDNFSRYQESEVRSYLREAGVVVFAVTLGGGPAATHETRHLRRLSRETGGWAYGVGDLEKMAGVVRAIGKAIRTQYTLTYAPVNTPSDGKFHRIAIQLAPPKDPGLAASWRDGYYAAEMQ